MLGGNRQVQCSIRNVEFHAEKLQGRAMRNVILTLVVALGMQWPAAAMDRPGDSSTTSADDLSGKWEVSPKDGNYGPSFAIGEMILTQYGNDIEGIYMPSPDQPGAKNCSKGPYKVSGKVSGRQVSLSAVGPASTLTGQAEIQSGTLTGDAIEIFKGSRCSGAVSGKFVMRRI